MKQLTLPLFLLGSTLVLSCKNNTEEKKTPEKENTTISVERLQDSIQKLSDDLAEERYFDISFNEDARYFFHENGIDDPKEFVLQQLMATNITKDENDFSDGLDWRELLLKMTLNDNKKLSFEVLDQTLYVSEQKP